MPKYVVVFYGPSGYQLDQCRDVEANSKEQAETLASKKKPRSYTKCERVVVIEQRPSSSHH
jgi:hypothetical protein